MSPTLVSPIAVPSLISVALGIQLKINSRTYKVTKKWQKSGKKGFLEDDLQKTGFLALKFTLVTLKITLVTLKLTLVTLKFTLVKY